MGTEFEGGLYHFRILLPAEYPFRPPSLMMLTPNGRFELNTKVCSDNDLFRFRLTFTRCRSVSASQIVSAIINCPIHCDVDSPFQTTRSCGNQHGVFGQVRRHVCRSQRLPAYALLAIIGLQGFFPLKGQQAVGVGSIEYPSAERKRLAAL